jgi:ribonuclease HII
VANPGPAPTRRYERELWERGFETVVGIDEVGRGAWAGPLMVGAAILPRDKRVLNVRDSKLLTEVERERLFERIAAWCVSWSVGAVSQAECDELGMTAAQKLACRRAIDGLGVVPDVAVTDGKWNFVSPTVAKVEMRVKADRYCLSVAAASILAKVVRDREMRRHADDYPHWSFDSNKGYPCPSHKAALTGYGPSAIHRRTWVFMDHFVPWTACPRIIRPEQPTLF